jgi:NAD(P)-dependent dehydrogenase (short-subunit alcohol dehydrogenase family)
MRTALVTGANSGIGFATVERLLEDGYRVIAHIRADPGQLGALENHERLRILTADLSDIESIVGLSSDPGLLAIDILINNAASYCFREDFYSILIDEVESLMRVNVIAPLILSQAVLPGMTERNWGRIINVSSVSVSHGGAARSIDYTFSKSAMESMTITLSKSFAAQNVLVNSVRVGVTDTKIHQLNKTKNLKERIRSIPIGRMADPKEIVEMIAFLCSERSSFVSGAILEVTGGEK